MIAGAWRLCLFTLRRDWVRIVVWLVVLGFFALSIPLVFEGMFGTEAERAAMAETMKNPAMTSLFGIAYGLDDFDSGSQMAAEMLLFTMMAVAVGNIIMVVRHTRKTEELGQLEMMLALPVGRLANLTGVLVAALFFNLAIIVEHAVLMTALGIDSMPFIGNLYYGLCLGLTGMFFAVLTAFVSQLTNNARSVMGISMALFLLAYVMRAVGDLGTEWLSLASPLGLPLRSEPYVDETFWPLAIMIAATVVVCVPAFVLQARRDMDAGLLPQRLGRSHARSSLLSPLGLAWRLGRGTFIAWAAGLFLVGAMYGSVFGDLEGFLDSSDYLKALFTNMDFTLTEQFLAMLMTIMPVLGTVPAIVLAIRLRSEERRNRLDALTSRSVSRTHVMTAYVVISMLACVVVNFLQLTGLWMAEAAVMADPLPFSEICAAGMSYLPAMLVVCGFTFTLIGLFPKLVNVSWALLAYAVFAGYLAPLLKLDDWVSMASPFYYVKQMPVESFDVVPIVVLTLVAIAFTVAGYLGYRRRDLDG